MNTKIEAIKAKDLLLTSLVVFFLGLIKGLEEFKEKQDEKTVDKEAETTTADPEPDGYIYGGRFYKNFKKFDGRTFSEKDQPKPFFFANNK